jgi:uncharacterized repeat protein (TIGR02543 family)
MKKLSILIIFLSLLILFQFDHNQLNAFQGVDNPGLINQLHGSLLVEGDRVIQLSAGGVHSAALTQNGKVYTWGTNSSGQLGTGTTGANSTTPIDITHQFPEGDKVIQISMGGLHSAALTETGQVFTWGRTETGAVGDGPLPSQFDFYRPQPINITSAFPVGDKVIQISMGYQHSSALTESGRVFTWGHNDGQIGDNTLTHRFVPTEITNGFPVGDKVIQLSMGAQHSSALTESGNVFTWGSGSLGQLGTGLNFEQRLVPTNITSQFPAEDKVIRVSIGGSTSSALTESGAVYTWGRNGNGQLGDNTTNFKIAPTEITNQFPSDIKIVALSIGEFHSSAITESGKIYTWGKNLQGQVGNNSQTQSSIPIDITSRFPVGDKVIYVSLGFEFSSALTASGKVYTWGNNAGGQLGDNSTTQRWVPVLVSPISTPFTVDLSFQSNGGSNIASINELPGTEISAPANPTRSGYTFGGWYSDSGLTQSYVFNTMPSENTTLYAKWNPVSYDITYNLNNGTNNSNNPATYHIETATIMLGVPTRNGYTFVGWYENAEFTGSAVTQITLGSIGNKTFFAKWTINQYTITFDSNGGSTVSAITQDYNTSIIAPANPTRTGYTFNGWSQAIPTNMPSENITITALWLMQVPMTGDLEIQSSDLIDKIDPSLIEGKDVEVSVSSEILSQDNVSSSDWDLASNIIDKNLKFNDFGTIAFQVDVLLKESAQDDILIQELIAPWSLTITIPVEHRGYQNYRIIRITNGVATLLESQYDSENHTLTFETDRLSLFIIAYDMSSGSGLWWLLLLLLIPFAFIIYLLLSRRNKIIIVAKDDDKEEEQKEEQKDESIVLTEAEKEDDKLVEPQVEAIVLEDVVLENLEAREQFEPNQVVEPGNYLEITPDLESTNRIIKVVDHQLPTTLEMNNKFISISDEEVSKVKVQVVNAHAFVKKTPGSYAEPGYYVEVDEESNIVNNFISLKRRLPPTTKKGHRWVRIEKRQIKKN